MNPLLQRVCPSPQTVVDMCVKLNDKKCRRFSNFRIALSLSLFLSLSLVLSPSFSLSLSLSCCLQLKTNLLLSPSQLLLQFPNVAADCVSCTCGQHSLVQHKTDVTPIPFRAQICSLPARQRKGRERVYRKMGTKK
jgi:hypothetical protein